MTSKPLLVHGTVRRPGGQAVAGARLMWLDSPLPMPDTAALSQSDGSFVLGVPVVGRYRLACQTDRHGQVQADIDVGPSGANVTLQLPR